MVHNTSLVDVVLTPESVEGLLLSVALTSVEEVVSSGVGESDLHDVIVDSLSDSAGSHEKFALDLDGQQVVSVSHNSKV